MAVDTLFLRWATPSIPSIFSKTMSLSLLEDLERNDGSEQKPYYMSKGLR